jgi:hypothetical protein
MPVRVRLRADPRTSDDIPRRLAVSQKCLKLQQKVSCEVSGSPLTD